MAGHGANAPTIVKVRFSGYRGPLLRLAHVGKGLKAPLSVRFWLPQETFGRSVRRSSLFSLISKTRASEGGWSGSIRCKVRRISDLHRTVRKTRDDLQFFAHRLDVAAQRRDIHVGASLQLGDRWVLNVQRFRWHSLR